jgi:hypothetical protein
MQLTKAQAVLLAVYRSNADFAEYRQEHAIAKLQVCPDWAVPFWLQKVTDWTSLMDWYDREAGKLLGVERYVSAYLRHEVRSC